MNIIQKEIQLRPVRRGFHLVTSEIEEAITELRTIKKGIAFLHIKHTSASLTLNENADPDVRSDMESIFNHIVPESQPYYVHTFEGADDMPAHAKSSLLGAGLTIHITNGRFNLGTWQGIYLCEHRNRGGARRMVVTVLGD